MQDPERSALKRFVGFFGWFSGSLAGLTAILYVFGFAATVVSNRMLGVDFEFYSRDAFVYVARGGDLLISSGMSFFASVVITLVVIAGFQRAINFIRARAPDALFRFGVLGRAPSGRTWPALVFMALVVGLMIGGLPGRNSDLSHALGMTGILFLDDAELCSVHHSVLGQRGAAHPDAIGGQSVVRAILTQDREQLVTAFTTIVAAAAVVLALASRIGPEVARRGIASWHMLALVILSFGAALALPAAYGAFLMGHDKPRVLGQVQGTDWQAGTSRLVALNDRGALVWNEQSRDVAFLPARTLEPLALQRAGPVRANAECDWVRRPGAAAGSGSGGVQG
ncbi:MAG: hypothetical protein AAF667_12765 [Pseudomonadota bacterium]